MRARDELRVAVDEWVKSGFEHDAWKMKNAARRVLSEPEPKPLTEAQTEALRLVDEWAIRSSAVWAETKEYLPQSLKQVLKDRHRELTPRTYAEVLNALHDNTFSASAHGTVDQAIELHEEALKLLKEQSK